MHVLKSLSQLIHCTFGNVGITLAIAIIPLLGAVGAAVDYSNTVAKRADVQKALDSAVLAAASEGSLPDGARRKYANDYFSNNVSSSCKSAETQFTFDPTKMQVDGTASCVVPSRFLKLIGVDSLRVSISSSAVGAPVGACVIALDPVTKESFSVSGLGKVNVPNCGIQVNSSSKTALKQSGNGSITAKSISIVGDYAKASVTTPMPNVLQPVMDDPLAGVPEPTVPASCDYTDVLFNSPMVFPADTVFCGNIVFNSDVTFEDGVHFFKAANVSTQSNAVLTGKSTMLFFDKDSVLTKSAGTGSFNITAMASGTYEGIAIFTSRLTPTSVVYTLTGDKNYFVNGTVYMPTVRLEMYGTAELNVTAKSGYVIAWQFFYQGDSSFTMDTFGGPSPIPLSSDGKVALIK